MFRRSEPIPATQPPAPGTAVRLDRPHDTCFRCGRPTPLGVSLCERDNPARIKSPSVTQVHGTILIGVIVGFVALLLLLRLASAAAGTFTASVGGTATRADGGLDVVLSVANSGSRPLGASCRIAIGGAPSFRDYVFFTGPIPAGETRQFTKTLPAPQSGSALPAGSVVVRCN